MHALPHSVSRPRSRPPPTHAAIRDSWTLRGKSGSVSFGVPAPFSWVLVHTRFSVPSKSLILHSCVTSGGSMVGLMVTSSKRAYAIPRSAVLRAPSPTAGHCWPISPQETLKHSKAGLVQSLWDLLVHTRFCLSSQASLVGMGFDSKCNFTPPTVFLGLLLCPWTWGIFFWWDPTFSCRELSNSAL